MNDVQIIIVTLLFMGLGILILEMGVEYRNLLRPALLKPHRDVTKAIGEATRVIMARIQQMEKRMTNRVDELLDLAAAEQTKVASLIAMFEGLQRQVIAAAGEDILTPSQKMRITQVFDAVKANVDDLDRALAANTVDTTKGAISDGPSAAEIKGNAGGAGASMDPGPAIGSTDGTAPATN